MRHDTLPLLATICVALAGCNTARDVLDEGRGPFDKSPATTSQAALEGLHESSWGNSGRWGGGSEILFVTNKRGNDLSVIDLSNGHELRRVPTCTNPHELAVAPDGNHLAVGCYGGTTVDILSLSTFDKVASIDLGENARPHGIVWHPNGNIYATAEGRKSVFWIRDPLSEEPGVFESATGKEGSHMLAVSTQWTHRLDHRSGLAHGDAG